MYSYFELVMLQERIADMARLAERRHMAEQKAKAGRRERRREKQRRTGDSPEKIAERRRRREPTPGENAARAGWAGFLGGSG